MAVGGAASSAQMLVTTVRSVAASATTVVVVTEPISVLEAGVHPCTILSRAGRGLRRNLAFVHSGITSPLGSPVAIDDTRLGRTHTSSDRETTESCGSQQLSYRGAVQGIHDGSRDVISFAYSVNHLFHDEPVSHDNVSYVVHLKCVERSFTVKLHFIAYCGLYSYGLYSCGIAMASIVMALYSHGPYSSPPVVCCQ